MFNDTSHRIAFDNCIDYMVRMIEKYGDCIKPDEINLIKCDSEDGYPADKGKCSAVVCNEENISTDKVEE